MTIPLTYPSLADADPLDVLRLIRSENVGPVTFFHLLRYFGSVRAALEGAPDLAARGGRRKPIRIASQAEAQAEMEATQRYGARFVLYGSSEYPAALATIHDPPPLLSVLGFTHLWQQMPPLALVGARNASANGCLFAHTLALELGKRGFLMVSGLARGIDTSAHKGALDSGTVAVIAGGIDNVYPPENKVLYTKIAEKGAIISEQPFGAVPQARSFPGRNRIIAGMSRGVVVIEASLGSGSLITAKFALDQGRDVFAVPGSPLDPRCKGSNGLIRQGAILTESADDIVQALAHAGMPASLPASQPASLREAPAPATDQDRERLHRLVLQKLGVEPVLVDELLVQCQVTAHLLLPVLLELELAGKLERHPGGSVSLRVAEAG